jgi:hypothetical protein
MTSPYITAAVAACRLPIRVLCEFDNPKYVFFVYEAYSPTALMCYPHTPATRAYTALRNRLLRENE